MSAERDLTRKTAMTAKFLFAWLLGPILLAYGQQNPQAATTAAFRESLENQRRSIEKQRVSLAQQLGQQPDSLKDPASGFLLPSTNQQNDSCLPLAVIDLESTIQDAAKKQSLSASLIKAVIKQESAFRPCAISPRGAQGLMQLMPATALELHISDPLDPEQNIQGGAAYLKQMMDRYKGDLRLALVAYNAGPARADQPKPSLKGAIAYPPETQHYVAGILAELGIAQWNEAEEASDAASILPPKAGPPDQADASSAPVAPPAAVPQPAPKP